MYGTFANFGHHQPLPRADSCATFHSWGILGSQTLVSTKADRRDLWPCLEVVGEGFDYVICSIRHNAVMSYRQLSLLISCQSSSLRTCSSILNACCKICFSRGVPQPYFRSICKTISPVFLKRWTKTYTQLNICYILGSSTDIYRTGSHHFQPSDGAPKSKGSEDIH